MKVVINKRHYGFLYTPNILYKELIKRGWELIIVNKWDDEVKNNNSCAIIDWNHMRDYGERYQFNDIFSKNLRTNKDLIEVIEQLGDKLVTDDCMLKIVEIPDNIEWDIRDYECVAGEYVEEKHRIWE